MEEIKETIEYVYSYDSINCVYFVRRADNLPLEQYIPGGLFRQIVMERVMQTGEPVVIGNIPNTFHFSSDGTRAFIDLNMRPFTAEEEETVFANIKVNQSTEPKTSENLVETENLKGIQKILSRSTLFRRKPKKKF